MRVGRKKSRRVVLLITGSVMLAACQKESPPPPAAWENLGDPNATNYAGTNQFGTNAPSGSGQRPHYSHSIFYPWKGSNGRIGTGSGSSSGSGSKSSNSSSTSRHGFGSTGHSSSGNGGRLLTDEWGQEGEIRQSKLRVSFALRDRSFPSALQPGKILARREAFSRSAAVCAEHQPQQVGRTGSA